jgi:hypothetical protein
MIPREITKHQPGKSGDVDLQSVCYRMGETWCPDLGLGVAVARCPLGKGTRTSHVPNIMAGAVVCALSGRLANCFRLALVKYSVWAMPIVSDHMVEDWNGG